MAARTATAPKPGPAASAPVKVKLNKQPNTESQLKLRASDKWARIVAAQAKFAGWQVAWSYPEYAMIKSGRKGEWAVICVHGKHAAALTGAAAQKLGRNRSFCTSCK